MFFRLSFVTLIFALLTLGTPVKHDVVEDVQDVYKTLQVLSRSINALPRNATLNEILAIHQDAVTIQSALQTAADDLTAGSELTDEQANAILRLLGTEILPLMKNTLTEFKGKKGIFSQVTQIVLLDLENFKNATDMFGTALIKMSPADKKTDEEGQIEDVDAALNSAINVFSH